MSQISQYYICGYCHKKIRFWHDWVGLRTQDVGMQTFWSHRAHYRCFVKKINEANP